MPHKMDSERVCEHDKCYADAAMLSLPARVKWICRLCGDEGTEEMGGGRMIVGSEFDRLMSKKLNGGFGAPK